jgi:hypothetical protein
VLLQEEAGWGHFIPLLVRKSVFYGAFIAAFVYWLWRSRSHGLSPETKKSEGVEAQ